MIAGNHDTPRTVETGSILSLFKTLGVTVVETEPKSIFFEERGLHVFAVPDGMARVRRAPMPEAKYNVLMMHAELEGVINRFGSIGQSGAPELTVKELAPEDWDYVAMGHYHVYRKLAENAYYSGATEYTSNNVWAEVDEQREWRIEGKGFIEHDLETGAHRFHPLYLSRTVIDIPEVSAVGLTAAELSEAIALAVDKCDGGIDDRIVRLIVRDVPRHILRDLDHRKIREYKRRALNFLLDARRPIPPRIESASGAPGRRASLTETVKAMLETRPVTPGIDRKSLVDLGLKYLDEVERLAPATVGDDA